jgi:hypothetical protein
MGPRSQHFFRSLLQFIICLFLYSTLYGNHTSDNHGRSSETSFEHDATLASAESFNAAKHTATYVFHTIDTPQTSGLLSHNTSLPASCSGSFQLVDATRGSTYFYPHNSRRCPHLLGCDTSSQGYTYGHNMGVATGPPHQPTKPQGSHPYPVFIDEEEISHNSGSSGTHVEHLAVKQEWIQASAHSSTDLAGVGAQFSW